MAAVTATSSWSGQGVAAVAAASPTAVGLLPRPSMSSHSRGSKLLFFSQMTARVCGGGGGGPFPSYRAQNGPRGERAHLRPMTQSLNILIEIKRFTKKKGFTNRIAKREEPTRKPKREREISEDPLKHVRVEKFTIKKEDKSTRVKGLLRRRDIVPWWRRRSDATTSISEFI